MLNSFNLMTELMQKMFENNKKTSVILHSDNKTRSERYILNLPHPVLWASLIDGFVNQVEVIQ